MAEPAYIIGIDLGTTNSVAAYTEATGDPGADPDIRVLEIPQVTAPDTVEKRNILPSFVYMPGRAEIQSGALDLPWGRPGETVVGEYARHRAAEVPHRVIASAKSWLCNTYADRSGPILPWEAPEDVGRISPVEASAAVLDHLRQAWNHQIAGFDPGLRMENQEIYLTVPASFDAVARELTVQAASAAGLSNIRLLEEPQAALYSWIGLSEGKWRKSVKKGERIFVCDVGGGTTDFSLIRVGEDNGELELERVAVGDHLLVGGDNMDLALAYHVRQVMAASGTRLDSWQVRGLVHACREVKEKVLSGDERQSHPIAVLGRGSRLIGGTLKTELSAQEVRDVIINGFFPFCEAADRPVSGERAALREAGLVYASDAAITRHMAAFLAGAAPEASSEMQTPDALLFNGGVMKARLLRERVREVIGSWFSRNNGLREIETRNDDLAVARGAAYYGRARRGHGIRIRGGLNRSYYIGIAAAMPAVPGMPVPVKALCVAPFGMEEGTRIPISQRTFVLVVGEPVRFDFLGSTVRRSDPAGAVVEDWYEEIEQITTLETVLDGEAGSAVRVTLESAATEIGTLEIWCVSETDERRWKLEFNVRQQQ